MIPPSTTITSEGRRTRRLLLWAGVAVVGFNLLLWATSSLTGSAVSGPSGSSYVTTPTGTAALAGTLERLGIGVERSREPLDDQLLAGIGTVVLAEVDGGGYTAGELNVLDGFLRSGGRVIVVGRTTVVERLVENPPRWQTAGVRTVHPTAPLAGVEQVPMSGFGSLQPGPDDTVLFADPGGVVTTVSRLVGEGELVWWADPHPVRNQGIGLPGSAVAVITTLAPEGSVLFDEFRHGYRLEGGLFEVMPAGWRLTFILAGISVVLTLIAYGRRFGPPYPRARDLGPGREEFLDSVGGLLARADAIDKESE